VFLHSGWHLFAIGGCVKSVLIAEDNDDARRGLSLVLERTRFKVYQVANGSTAIKAVRDYRPDILLLDLVLSGPTTGFDVCEQIKNDPVTAGTFVIVMSGKNSKADIARAQAAGANAYLVKPFRLSKLLDMVIKHEELNHQFTLESEI